MNATPPEKPALARRGLRPKPAIRRQKRSRGLAIKSILVPVDFSETSTAALRYAATLAQDYGAEISLIHVVEPDAYNLLSGNDFSDSNVTFVESATARLAKLAREEIPPAISVNLWVQIGAPYAEITSAAKILNSNVIVIATHGYTGFRHAILGSTAERVVRHAHCPVFVIRKPETSKPKGIL